LWQIFKRNKNIIIMKEVIWKPHFAISAQQQYHQEEQNQFFSPVQVAEEIMNYPGKIQYRQFKGTSEEIAQLRSILIKRGLFASNGGSKTLAKPTDLPLSADRQETGDYRDTRCLIVSFHDDCIFFSIESQNICSYPALWDQKNRRPKIRK
jgi:hypothetical protein